MAGIKWSPEEDQKLQDSFFASSREDILASLPGRSWESIVSHSVKLGLNRKRKDSRKADCTRLLEETPEAYYWAGFIMADGCLMQDTWRLRVSLAIKDRRHLQKLGEFLKTEVSTYREETQVTLSAQNKEVLPIFAAKFDIKPQKTYNPPNLKNKIPDHLFTSFLIGFIDGDGCISRLKRRNLDFSIRIKVHASWLPILQFFEDQVYRLSGIPLSISRMVKINNQGYAQLAFTNSKVVHWLNQERKDKLLPVLERKWDLIQGSPKTRYDEGAKTKELILKYGADGLKLKEISELTGVGISYISTVMRKNGIKRRGI